MRSVIGFSDIKIRKMLSSIYDDITSTFTVKNFNVPNEDEPKKKLKVVYIEMANNFNHLFVANSKKENTTYIFETNKTIKNLSDDEHSIILKALDIDEEEKDKANLKEWFTSQKGFRYIGKFEDFFAEYDIAGKKIKE